MTASTTPSSSSTGNCWPLLLFLTSCFASEFLSRYQILSWLFVLTGDVAKIDFQSLLSLADEGIDVSFLKPRGKKRLNSHISYLSCGRRGGAMFSALLSGTNGGCLTVWRMYLHVYQSTFVRFLSTLSLLKPLS